jgi:hypothetical protein
VYLSSHRLYCLVALSLSHRFHYFAHKFYFAHTHDNLAKLHVILPQKASEPASQQVSQKASEVGSKPSSKPASEEGSEPGSKPAKLVS